MGIIQNKRRGRAYQAKLAQLVGGVNVGTLGEEDVMHPEFSYEAKTYAKNAKSNKGRDWTGEIALTDADGGKYINRIAIVEMYSNAYSSIIMLRLYWWSTILSTNARATIPKPKVCSANVFKGNTYMNQAEANCPDGKVPVVVVHTVGNRHDNDIVLIRKLYWESVLAVLKANTPK